MKIFVEDLLQHTLHDVFVSGYIDFDGVQKFSPLYQKLYFLVGKLTYELSADFLWNIDVRSVENITAWFDVDEDDSFGISSIYNQIFKTELPIQISSISYYVDAETSLVRFLQIHYLLAQKQKIIVLNPNNTFGFSLSDNADEEIAWLSESQSLGIKSTKVTRSL